MQYRLEKAVMTDDNFRKTYNELTEKTYGFTFEDWYQNGYWSKSNQPYTLFDGDRAVANVSINHMEVFRQGKLRHYIQIGTVMTDEAYSHQGLSRYLMDEIKKDWAHRCDAMFLFANDSVLDFYPKFGFMREKQYQFTRELELEACQCPEAKASAGRKAETATAACRRLDMDTQQDREFLKNYYEKTNPFSALQVLHNFGLLMFYCGSFMKDCVYYSEEQDAVVIGEQDGEVFRCYDVYCDADKNLMEILAETAAAGTKTVSLEFTPVDAAGFTISRLEDDDSALFVLEGGENIFRDEVLRFPEISHT